MSTPADAAVTPANKTRIFRWIMICIVAVFILLAAIAAEFVARGYERHRATPPDYFPQMYYPHRRLRYGLVPGLDYYGWFKINSLGFRGREFSAIKPKGTLRIVCLGGSTTFDIGSVGKALPWPEVMEAELRKRLGNDHIEVLNLGIPGATSLDSLIDLQMRALDLQPDLVIVYQAHNDFVYSFPLPHPAADGFYPLEIEPRSSVMRWVRNHSVLYAKTEGRVTDRLSGAWRAVTHVFSSDDEKPATAADLDRSLEHGFQGYQANMKAIAAIARANGVTLVLPEVTMPFPSEKTHGCDACAKLSPVFANLAPARIEAMFARYNGVLPVLASEGPGVHYVPTDDFVPPEDKYWHDSVHFGPEGSERMGTKLAAALVPILSQLPKPE